MFDPKVLLDALVGASARPDEQEQSGRPGTPSPVGAQIEQTINSLTGQSAGELLQKAKDVVARNPGLAQAAAIGLAGLLFGNRKTGGGGIPSSFAKLGGLALIGTLAYKAYQASQQESGDAASGPAMGGLSLPEKSSFHPATQTEDDAMLYLRAMVAAATADGRVDEEERNRIVSGLGKAGMDPDAMRWLQQELAAPADVDELSSNVNSPEKAAQVYAAARIAIDPDTLQERDFLHRLADALDLDPSVRRQVDDAAAGLKA
ncbi:tellurite resistance TerB family protein [Microvirga flavescens]|uniref:tellurite resistance TerB family protein n=1 Tax=Microvirga flavescens TaxID=2249811 RepID=UPI000DD8E0B4|nr:tellurite resistance TerB family protein [Microvirga flavescens]